MPVDRDVNFLALSDSKFVQTPGLDSAAQLVTVNDGLIDFC